MENKKYFKQAEILIQALPYIKKFSGKTVVIKYGGAAMTDEKIKKTVIEDIALMKLVGVKPVIVHGGGKDINTMLHRVGIESKFIGGLRFTDKETMDIVQMILAGKINKDLVSFFSMQGMDAIGITGQDGRIFEVEKYDEGQDIGFVGKVKKVNTEFLRRLIDEDFIPIIAPIGVDYNGDSYNINADFVACDIAGAMKSEKLIFMSDISGVYTKEGDQIIKRINITDVDDLIGNGTLTGGMIPKIKGAKSSVKQGVNGVHIIDGRLEHSLLLELFTDYGIGTMITK